MVTSPTHAPPRSGLAEQFTWARDQVDSDRASLLAATIGAPSEGVAPIDDFVAGLDHVGFLAGEPVEVVAAAARRAGFWRGHATEPSTVVARELGDRLGAAEVPTTIFRAWPDDGPGVEVFLPAGVPAPVLADWRQAGVGRHVAFALRDAGALEPVLALLEAAGYRRPPVMRAGPVTVGRVAIMYLDRSDGTRVELCLAR